MKFGVAVDVNRTDIVKLSDVILWYYRMPVIIHFSLMH